MKNALSSVAGLPESFGHFRARSGGLGVERRYRTLIPQYYLSLIDPEDPNDPIARMAIADASELDASSGAWRDPIGDLSRQVVPRLTHRYPDRALLHTTNLCPMYCRFCFRKNLMNETEERLYHGSFDQAFRYLLDHPEVEELIFSGGDPWMLSDARLAALLAEAGRVPSLRRLRFHTRMPVTLPSRVSPELVAALGRGHSCRVFVVTHFNHPRELTAHSAEACRRLITGGFNVLNQSVLLRGVNDNAELLRSLFRGLGDYGVIPYYLHQCDSVSGAEHFRVDLKEGYKIWNELRGTLPGYLIPEYVVDNPQGSGKRPVNAPR